MVFDLGGMTEQRSQRQDRGRRLFVRRWRQEGGSSLMGLFRVELFAALNPCYLAVPHRPMQRLKCCKSTVETWRVIDGAWKEKVGAETETRAKS